ncbi:MAG: hypothetical protein LBM66_06565 [Bifidobacteriaceae bacterium]|jgi:hypothetical protein|nr:hypothetical protein [Bifidobacteriaceae bacterium]
MISDTPLEAIGTIDTAGAPNTPWQASLVPHQACPALTPEAMAEIRRRDAELREHPEIGIPWDEMKAWLKRKWG